MLVLLFAPIVLIIVYAFDPAVVETWPIKGFTLHWFSVAWHDPDVRAAFLLSIRVGLVAMGIALPLWIFGAIRQGQQLPEVNAVVTIVIALTLIPVALAARIAGAGSVSRTGGRG